jgi:hypothetical protein
MASEDFTQAQAPNTYGAWTNSELINESAFLDDFCPNLDEPFDFSLKLDEYKRRDRDSVASSQSSYTTADVSYGFHNPLISGESTHSLDARRFEPNSQGTSAWAQETAPEEGTQRLECSACSRAFSNLTALDKHTQSTSHKAWRCQETGCGKSYARRDTFLRHRSKHSDNSHSCVNCLLDGKEKVFKRKDHLREHIRSCHSKGNDGTRFVQVLCPSWTTKLTVSVRMVNDHARDPAMGASRSRSHSRASVKSETFMTTQQQAMKDLLKSLSTVLGDRHPSLIEELDRLNSLSATDMESVAENMAISALTKTYLSNPEEFASPFAKGDP